jgi:flavin reductase (DIM6/NTAB) family NADH-FMN oxidoreductase RutF
MAKRITNKLTMSPLPAPTVLVTVQTEDKGPNIITIAWTGVLCSTPPTVYIGVQPTRYSHSMLKESMEYVINIPSENLAKMTDYCGIVSGKAVNKFEKTGLTPIPASLVKAPLIKECAVNLECKVKDVLNLGSHDIFIAEVVAVHYDEEVLQENGSPDIEKIKPYSCSLGEYRSMGDKLGSMGYSMKSIND